MFDEENFIEMLSYFKNHSLCKNKDETSIRYAKENDREKRERRSERERKVEGEL